MFLDMVYDHTLCMDGYMGSFAFIGKKSQFGVRAHWALELKDVTLQAPGPNAGCKK